jgi:hypothetical protein
MTKDSLFHKCFWNNYKKMNLDTNHKPFTKTI